MKKGKLAKAICIILFCTMLAGCNAFIAVHQMKEALDQVAESWNGTCKHPWLCREEDFDEAYLTRFRANALRSLRCSGLQTYQMPPMPGTDAARDEGSPIPERL